MQIGLVCKGKYTGNTYLPHNEFRGAPVLLMTALLRIPHLHTAKNL